MNRNEVREFCEKRHKYQLRKSGEPYINHVVEVAVIAEKLAKEITNDFPYLKEELDSIFCAGLLHDVIEDTNTDYEDIVRITNKRVANWISKLSNDKRIPVEIRTSIYYNEIQCSCIEIKIIKLADIYSNLIGIKGNEGYEWISHFVNKVKDGLAVLSPELITLDVYVECSKIIEEWNQKLSNHSN